VVGSIQIVAGSAVAFGAEGNRLSLLVHSGSLRGCLHPFQMSAPFDYFARDRYLNLDGISFAFLLSPPHFDPGRDPSGLRHLADCCADENLLLLELEIYMLDILARLDVATPIE